MGIPFLGAIPLATVIRTTADEGRPIMISDPESSQAKSFMRVAENLAAQISIRTFAPSEGIVQPVVWKS